MYVYVCNVSMFIYICLCIKQSAYCCVCVSVRMFPQHCSGTGDGRARWDSAQSVHHLLFKQKQGITAPAWWMMLLHVPLKQPVLNSLNFSSLLSLKLCLSKRALFYFALQFAWTTDNRVAFWLGSSNSAILCFQFNKLHTHKYTANIFLCQVQTHFHWEYSWTYFEGICGLSLHAWLFLTPLSKEPKWEAGFSLH